MGEGRGGHSNSTFYSVKLCVMINFSLQHNVLCLRFVVVLYSVYSLYAVTFFVLISNSYTNLKSSKYLNALVLFSLITSEIFQLPHQYRYQFVGDVMTDM